MTQEIGIKNLKVYETNFKQSEKTNETNNNGSDISIFFNSGIEKGSDVINDFREDEIIFENKIFDLDKLKKIIEKIKGGKPEDINNIGNNKIENNPNVNNNSPDEEKPITADNILSVVAGSGELSDYSGEELFEIYKDYFLTLGQGTRANDDPMSNLNHSKDTAVIIKLLAGASEEQIKGFFDAMKECAGSDESYQWMRDSMADMLLWAGYADVTSAESSAFWDTINQFKDLFPEVKPDIYA